MKKLLYILSLIGVNCLYAQQNINNISDSISGQFFWMGKLIVGLSFVAGVGFLIAAIMKFKQFKDNPQQTPIGTPIVMMLIAILLMFLPAIMTPAGETVFGEEGMVSGKVLGAGEDIGSLYG